MYFVLGTQIPYNQGISPYALRRLVTYCRYQRNRIFGRGVGWRGFLLPRLLDAFSEFKANIIIWAYWHLPVFIFPHFTDGIDPKLYLVLYPGATFLAAIMFTKIWKWTNGSVFMASLAKLQTTQRRVYWDLANYTNKELFYLKLFCMLLIAMAFVAIDVVKQRMKKQSN